MGDTCPNPPGATADGCVISGRLSRFSVSGNQASAEQVLLEGWRQQYPSHSIGQVEFGPDGALYASAGDGASFNFVDYGQDGDPINPLGDPPVPVGTAQAPPDAQGGALRSQSPRRPNGPVVLNGSIVRLDPATGLGLPDNPLASSSDLNAQRIVAFGLRNPFRIASRPGKDELWIADVGWNEWEEVNRLALGASTPQNFGWPCYEGAAKQPGYDGADLTSCESLYATNQHVAPYFSYRHSQGVSLADECGRGSSSVTGIAFYTGSGYPAAYQGAMFFSDYSRRCIYVMSAGENGEPDPESARSFHADADGPVFLTTGPGGDLFYAALTSGTIQRISYLRPSAAFTALPSEGQVPLVVTFDASSSVKPLPQDTLSYAWDLDGDGNFDDSSDAAPAFLYDSVGEYQVRLKVTDQRGISDVSAPLAIRATSQPPEVSSPPEVYIDEPSAELSWSVGETIQFSGHARDAEDGELPASALSWQVLIQHCPDGCHIHELLTFDGVASGSFVTEDHDYPMHLELILSATDSSGQKRSVRRAIMPNTVSLTFDTSPSNLQLVVGPSAQTTPFARRVIRGSENSVSAAETQVVDGVTWRFQAWSDGLSRAHQLASAQAPARYVASYAPAGGLMGEYYDELGFTGAGLSRIDPEIDFAWGQGSPDPSIGPDSFSVRWSGQLLADFDESYDFSTISDDGVRLSIDGAIVIDHFDSHGPTKDTGSLALSAGWHDVLLEYFENGGGAQIQWTWSSASQPEQVVPESHLRPGCDASGACGAGLDCGTSELCQAACDPTQCKGSKHCRLNGATTCVALCSGLECPGGDVCKSGTCVDACAGVSCPSGRHCELGKCVDDPPPSGQGGAGGEGGEAGAAMAGSGNTEGGAPARGGAGSDDGGASDGGASDGGAPGSAGEPAGGAAGESAAGGAAAGEGGFALGGAPGVGDGGKPSSEGSAGSPDRENAGSGGAAAGSNEDGAAGRATDGGAHDGAAGTPGGDDEPGCSCRAAGHSRKAPSAWLLVGLVLLGRRRRRS